jgi:NADH:ubiquinone reductase (H+-translocating)
MQAVTRSPTRVLVVGCGFGGYHAVRRLERRLSPEDAEITVVTPRDHLLYTPLLPEVAGGLLDPRDITVALTGRVRSRVLLGHVDGLDVERRVAGVTDPEGRHTELGWDRLVLAAGSVSSSVPIAGLAEHAVGFKTTADAAFLRDHVLRQLELSVVTEDPQLRADRSTFVVIGAGFAGTELVAFLQRLGQAFAHQHASRHPVTPRWVLVNATPHVLPELGRDLGARALAVLRRRGIDVRLSTSVEQVSPMGVRTSDGSFIGSRTVVWCGGVMPNPLVRQLGVPLDRGRVRVDSRLGVDGLPGVFALGDLAAVPDLTRPGHDTAPTAQHAMRQGRTVADAVVASLGRGKVRPYRHRDLGLAADLGGWQGVAKPLGVPLTGPAARIAARGYHLAAIPGNRARVAASWLTSVGRSPLLVHLDLGERPRVGPASPV